MNEVVSRVLRQILLVLATMDRCADDKKQLQALQNAPLGDWPRTLHGAGRTMTAGLWAEYLAHIAQNWGPAIQTLTALLPEQRRQYAADYSPGEHVLDCTAGVLNALAEADFSQAHEFEESDSLVSLMQELARAVEAFGEGRMAVKIAQAGILLGPGHGSETEALVSCCIELGVRERLFDLTASYAVLLANLIAKSIDDCPERRLEAFDACEVAIERIARCSAHEQPALAAELFNVVCRTHDLAILACRLLAFVPTLRQAPRADMAAGASLVWPKRVSYDSQEEWDSEELDLALNRELEADEARFKLEPVPAGDRPHTEWWTWRVAHPTYRSVVPFADSFLKEARFDDLLLVLSHEVTHVYSLLGGLGLALQCLRCAEFMHVAAQLPPPVESCGTMEEVFEHVCAHCAAPGGQDQRQLFHIEAGIELASKAQALQDIWTPWLEGLAVFGETAADPTLDDDRAGVVGDAFHGLVAFYLDSNEPGNTAASRFEQAWAQAMKARGPERLGRYFEDVHTPYFAGYMALRTVLSAWRESLGRPLASTKAFHLLLNATRCGVLDAIPDLSLRSDAFRNKAQARMTAWVSRLAALPKEDIEMFLRPPGQPDPVYAWKNNRLQQIPADGVDACSDFEDRLIKRWLREAMCSLTGLGDEQRIEGASDDTHKAVAASMDEARNYLDTEPGRRALDASQLVVNRFINAGTVLPIGQTDAKFYLNREPGASVAHMVIALRTFQPNEKANIRSGHQVLLKVPSEEMHLIVDHYKQTGNPRVTVTRIIDLGLSGPGRPSVPLHFYRFRYGDWTQTTWAWDPRACLDRVDHKEFLAIAESRVQRDAFEKLYHGPTLVGHAAVVRALDRVRAPGWPDDLRPWQVSVQALAERFLEEAREHGQRRRAASALLGAVFKDSSLFDDPLNIDFETLTERCPEQRESIVNALFQTARQPCPDPMMAGAIGTFGAPHPYFFSLRTAGWDVRPARVYSRRRQWQSLFWSVKKHIFAR